MSIESQMEREEEHLFEQLNEGDIDQAEFNKQMNEIQREYRAMAEESAQDAYDNEMRNW